MQVGTRPGSTPSWLNLIEYFFSILSKRGLASVQQPKQDLKELLHRFLASYNESCNPFTWTKGPEHLQRIIGTTKKPRRRPAKGLMGRCVSAGAEFQNCGGAAL